MWMIAWKSFMNFKNPQKILLILKRKKMLPLMKEELKSY